MTSTQIRKSFLDFFKSRHHTIVPSSSLMPDSPNLLFTNAGMNQFVPIFLGQTKCPYTPGRAADTQKCIRAGGKHNDLDDVGLDTYHHTFFEMLGNWSFGDYFKREAIEWAWELVVMAWGFPPARLYATVFCPYLDEPGWEAKWKTELEQILVLTMTSPEFISPNPNASPFEVADQEAAMYWAKKFQTAGLDPRVHIVPGNKKDNFWMMGETGPCGPCSELHVDLTPAGDTKGSLVNNGDARCIEIWNLVFIQFNANPDGTFAPLPAQHVDTGMGFERVTSIIQGTKGLTDFKTAKISNYETDIFRPIFDAIETLGGKLYGSTLPPADLSKINDRQATDIAFRVIADHIRTLSFAIADGIQPSNEGRGYVLRRILRRAVRYGRTFHLREPFFYKLVDVVADTMGDVFPEIRAKKKHVQDVIRMEEEAFNKTLDSGLEVFEKIIALTAYLETAARSLNEIARSFQVTRERINKTQEKAKTVLLEKRARAEAKRMQELVAAVDSDLLERTATRDAAELPRHAGRFAAALESAVADEAAESASDEFIKELPPQLDALLRGAKAVEENRGRIQGAAAFLLYDTYGFPLDLTELMARERGLSVDKEGFEKLMEEQRARARAAQKKEVIEVSKVETTTTPTKFVGYDKLETPAKVLQVVSLKDKTAVILDTSACYAEMGGQVGDVAELNADDHVWYVTNTQKSGNTWLHFIGAEHGKWRTEQNAGGQWVKVLEANNNPSDAAPRVGCLVELRVNQARREAIQRHHTVTHLLHWALHKVVSEDVSQKGSFVGPEKLTFDFNSAPLTADQLEAIEDLVNERILENAGVSWTEVPYADVKSRKDVMQFFGDKYGDTVRVVQIGGHAQKLDGYSMELCGGTHTRATGEIGLFRIVGENAIAAGVRRIEAVAGLTAFDATRLDRELIKAVASKVSSPIHELEKKIESLLAHQKELEKQVKLALLRNASNAASELLAHAAAVNGIPLITHNLGDADGEFLQAIADALKGRFKGVVVLGGGSKEAVTLIATVSPDFTARAQAGKIIQQIAPIVGGKGGGKPDNARGGGKDASKLDEALAKAKSLLG
jgi:alanyl-tRNA synthetase